MLEEAPQVENVGGDEAGQAVIVRYENEEVVVEVEGHRGGLLVLNDTYYPGWRAFVDGSERSILQANHVFRAVVIPAGARQVHFCFDSDSVRWGGWISGIGWFCWMFMLVLFWSKVGWVLPLPSENVPPVGPLPSPVGRGHSSSYSTEPACDGLFGVGR